MEHKGTVAEFGANRNTTDVCEGLRTVRVDWRIMLDLILLLLLVSLLLTLAVDGAGISAEMRMVEIVRFDLNVCQ